MNCLNDGLPVANPLPIIAKLSGLTNDVICINTQRGEAPKPTNTMESFRQFAKTNPQLAMSALFQLPADHPAIAHGVTVHHIPQASELPANGSLYTTQSDDPELDAMLDRILRGEDDNGFGNQAGMGHQFYPMGMNSGAPEGFN
uniref:Truncated mat A-1 n=1 Tax=Humicola hyalothermophila TaxID=1486343 RepID=A0A0M3R6L3_9PEZI|nr:truncated mat A-1 [Humicola hyalothermophila]